MNTTTLDILQAATLCVASAGSIKDRLTVAYRNHLACIEETELPGELREDFQVLIHALTREPASLRGEDAVRATVRKMSSEEASEISFSLVRLYGAVSRLNAVGARSRKPAANVVPLYLAEA